MGCCSSVKANQQGSIIRRPQPIDLKPPPAVESIRANDQLITRMQQVSSFKCQVVSPLQLHNHLVYAREAMKA